MKTLRRTIHPEIRVIDAKAGLVEYIASDESLDSYNEIVKAAGARFNRFQKNAPFVDSHNYDSIDCLLGNVVDFSVKGRRVVETAQWAIDAGLPEDHLANIGFKLTAAGYLKAVSIGFMPISSVSKWDSNPTAFNQALKDMQIAPGTDVRTIYTEWEQLELSACIIGANANAVAQIEKAYQAGVLSDSDINKFENVSHEFATAFEARRLQRRTYSFPSSQPSDAVAQMVKALGGKPNPEHPPKKTMSKNNFLKDFSRLTAGTKTTFEDLEFARRSDDQTGLRTAMVRTSRALAGEQRLAGDPVDRYFAAHPEEKVLWNAVARKLTKSVVKPDSAEGNAWEAFQKSFQPGIAPGDSFGQGLLSFAVSPDIFDLLYVYGAFADLGVSEMPGQYTKFVIVNGLPTIFVYPSDQQGQVSVPIDTTTKGLNLGGPDVAQVCNTFIGLIEASRELLNDPRVDLAALIFRLFFQAISGAIDYCAFQGNGAGDLTNAYQTGIFLDGNIKSYQPGIGQTQIAQLHRNDFISTVGVVNPAALQRPCRWYISPKLITGLLKLKDGDGASWLLKTPADTGGEWNLVGFPVTWAAAAQANELPGQKIAAFGEPNSYCVGIRNAFELMSSEGSQFHRNINQLRAIARGKCATRDATGFATLKLSVQ